MNALEGRLCPIIPNLNGYDLLFFYDGTAFQLGFSEQLQTLWFSDLIGQHVAQPCLFQEYGRSFSSLVVSLKIFVWERAL